VLWESILLQCAHSQLLVWIMKQWWCECSLLPLTVPSFLLFYPQTNTFNITHTFWTLWELQNEFPCLMMIYLGEEREHSHHHCFIIQTKSWLCAHWSRIDSHNTVILRNESIHTHLFYFLYCTQSWFIFLFYLSLNLQSTVSYKFHV